jgi:hypothetical protein
MKRDFNKSVGNPKTRNKSKIMTLSGSPNPQNIVVRKHKKKHRRNKEGGQSISSGSPNAKTVDHSGSPMTKKKGYLDTIADQEAKLISKNSLEEGEQFE